MMLPRIRVDIIITTGHASHSSNPMMKNRGMRTPIFAGQPTDRRLDRVDSYIGHRITTTTKTTTTTTRKITHNDNDNDHDNDNSK